MLQFQPPPYIPPQQEPTFDEQFGRPIRDLAGVLNQFRQNGREDKFRQFQMEMMKAKEAREQGLYNNEQTKFAYDYGDPTANSPTTPGGFNQPDPRMSLYQPATMPGESQYGNIMGGAEPDSYAPRAAPAAPAPDPGGMPPGMMGPQPAPAPDAEPSGPGPGPQLGAPAGNSGLVARFRQWQDARRGANQPPDMTQDLTDQQLFAPGFGAKKREDYLKTRKSKLEEKDLSRKTELTDADIKLKGAEADYYKNTKGKTGGRYQGWTPQSLETRKRNLLNQMRYAPLAERDSIMEDIKSIDDIQSQTLNAYGGGSAAGGEPGAAPRPRPALRPRPGAAGAPRFNKGQVAVNPQTKQRLQFNGSGWVPLP